MTEYIKNLENQILTTTTRINKQQEEMATQNTKIAQQNTKFAELNTEIAQQNTKFAELNTEIAQQNTKFAKLNTEIAQQNTKFSELNTEIAQQNTKFAELNTEIAQQNTKFAKLNTEIAQQNTKFAELNTEIAQQNTKFAKLNTNIANQETQIAKQNTAFAKINTRFAESELNCSIDKNKLKPEEKQNQRETCDCKTGTSIPINVATGKPAAQSSTFEEATADRAVDGNTMRSWSSGSCAHTDSRADSWWCVDLLRDYNISTIAITNRNTLEERLAGFNIRVSSTGSCDGAGFISAKVCYTEPGVKKGLYSVKGCDDGRQMFGRYVFIGGPGQYLTICEVEIYN